MTNIFSSAKDEQAQLQFAMLNPVTEEEMELIAFKKQAKIDAIGCLLIVALVGFLTYKYKQKIVIAIVWIGLVVGLVSYAVLRKNELHLLEQKANIAHEIAVEKGKKIIEEENAKKQIFTKQLQIENTQLLTSEQIKELMPKAPNTRNIDMNCSSVSAGYATCSGTITDR